MQKSQEGRVRPKKLSRRQVSIQARIIACFMVMGEKEGKRWAALHEKKPWYRGRYRTFPGNGFGGVKRSGMKMVRKLLKQNRQPIQTKKISRNKRRDIRQWCAKQKGPSYKILKAGRSYHMESVA